jgi:nonsense-mediated mRNA decay protein 3
VLSLTHLSSSSSPLSFSVEVAPVCRDDLICLPSKFAASTGNIIPLVLCAKISNMIHVLDPGTGQVGEILAINFWKHPFRSISSAKQLVEFIILDVNPLPSPPGRFQLAEAQVARASDLGRNDTQFFCRTHLGHLLKPGDSALGYDVATSNFGEDDLASFGSRRQLPDVILVRKIYPQAVRRSRVWKLKQLPKDEEMKPGDAHRAKQDYEQFLESLENDPDTRSRINIYKDRRAIVKTQREREMDQMLDIGQKVVPAPAGVPHAAAAAEEGEEDPEAIRLEELLEDLSLSENASQAGDHEEVVFEDE